MEKSLQAQKELAKKLSTLAENKAFLGSEFLIWLWHRIEDGVFPVKLTRPKDCNLVGGKEIAVDLWFDDRLFLATLGRVGHDQLLRGGSPSHSPEAAASLGSGKVVREVKIGMRAEGVGCFTAVLNSSNLAPRSIHLPEEGENGEEEAPERPFLKGSELLARRIEITNLFINFLDALFSRFIDERISSEWESKPAKDIRRWICDRTPERLASLH